MCTAGAQARNTRAMGSTARRGERAATDGARTTDEGALRPRAVRPKERRSGGAAGGRRALSCLFTSRIWLHISLRPADAGRRARLSRGEAIRT